MKKLLIASIFTFWSTTSLAYTYTCHVVDGNESVIGSMKVDTTKDPQLVELGEGIVTVCGGAVIEQMDMPDMLLFCAHVQIGQDELIGLKGHQILALDGIISLSATAENAGFMISDTQLATLNTNVVTICSGT